MKKKEAKKQIDAKLLEYVKYHSQIETIARTLEYVEKNKDTIDDYIRVVREGTRWKAEEAEKKAKIRLEILSIIDEIEV